MIIFILIHIQRKKINTQFFKKNRKLKSKGKGNVDSIFFQRIKLLMKIVIPSYTCPQLLDILQLTIFLIIRTFLSIYIASVNGKVVKSIIQMNYQNFVLRIINLGLISIPASFVNSYLDYLNKSLSIRFRKSLTYYFHQNYLKDKIFYQLTNLDQRVSNPDQRLTTDIQKWANSLSLIYSNFSKPLLDIVLFSQRLSVLVGWWGPLVVIIWYCISGVLIRFASPEFGLLTAIQQRLQGEYRSCHSQLVNHSEEVAFYKGNKWQKERINESFKVLLNNQNLMNHTEDIHFKKLFMGVFDSMLVKYGALLVGYAVVGLPVFGPSSQQYLRSINSDPSAITRDYVRNSSLLINLAKAIGRLVSSYKEIQHLAGFTTLVYEMQEVLRDLQKGIYHRVQVNQNKEQFPIRLGSYQNIHQLQKGTYYNSQNTIQFDNVPIISPNGDCLVDKITFHIQPGMNCIITGPNGCGKSSLFRILSQLWPLQGGKLKRPHIDKLFYIPQRPYLPSGTLRDQIIYPNNKLQMLRKKIKDQNLKELLEQVKLDYLVDREGGFDKVNDWKDVLSGGEKQRIAMARLFYHKPLFAILDQCTSAVSMDVQAHIYNKAKKLEITLFTVSHRSSLFKFHQYLLKFDGEGKCEFKKLQERE